MSDQKDREREAYRSLMAAPDSFEKGFTWRTVVGALFLGFVMMPVSMYMGLVVGGNTVGDAARWVTVILFLEVAKRSMVALKQQELFVLYYMAGMVVASPFQTLLFHQYLVVSPAAHDLDLVGQFPAWVAPSKDAIVGSGRTFFTWGWAGPIGLMVLGHVLLRMDHFGLGYLLYRLTSDVERLPFPLAPVGAAGAIALAERAQDKQTWRWRTFVIGAVLGLMYGALYTALPILSSAVFGKAMRIIPLPFLELTDKTNAILPAVATGITVDLMLVILGFVLPFWSVIGALIAILMGFFMNPALYKMGLLPSWNASMDTPQTQVANYFDFYLSWNMGLGLSIALIGFWALFKAVAKTKARDGRGADGLDFSKLWNRNALRGDLSVWTSLLIYLFSTGCYIAVAKWLVPDFPIWFFLLYGFFYTPLIGYATARLEGMAGQAANIPFVREAGFILAARWGGYSGIGIWFAPIPIHNYGMATVGFRQAELTGTNLRSLVKAELLLGPMLLMACVIFSQLIWSLGAIPSDAYPYAQKLWDQQARTQLLMYSSTSGGTSSFFDAIKPVVILIGALVGTCTYALLAAFSLPTLLLYGLVRGFSHALPHAIFFEFVGAMLGRYYLEKRFGRQTWRQYAPILLAGYGCGLGLISAGSIAIDMISRAVTQMLY